MSSRFGAETPSSVGLDKGCNEGLPSKPRRDWIIEEVEAVIANGLHKLAHEEEAMKQLQQEVHKKVKTNQVRLYHWKDV